MKRFIRYFFEEKEGKVSSNTKGVLHELLVGRHLNGGEHMEAHHNSEGETPEQAHDRLKSTLTDAQYNEINNKAKAAADDIRKKVGAHGEVHKVQWTSKAGDLHKATGIHATQKQDASDIVITTKNKKGEIKHHGVSLKVTDKKNKHVPVSNPGMESTYGGNAILKKHREEIAKAHPDLAKIEGTEAKKAWLKSNAKANADVRARNTKTLNDITQHLHNKLNSMSSEELAHHIRHHVLAAHSTPMQEQGHEHFRHTTGGVGGDFSMHHGDPSQDHEHILNDHKNIKAVRRGTSIIFTHNNKPFAKHRMKFENQGNPNSSVKGSGELM
jgi:hypothetical protein